MTTDISATLQERGSRYGSFDTHAQITQQLKFVINRALFEQKKVLTASMKESLDMIAHKIGRIVNGDPHYADSWIDIAGYAQLVADELEDKLDAELAEKAASELNDGLAAVPVSELDDERPGFTPVTDEHRQWTEEILTDLEARRQGEV